MIRQFNHSRALLGINVVVVIGLLLSLLGAAILMPEQRASADGGDFSLDFIAAGPYTYDHSTGGGAYNDRTIDKNIGVVESLEGGVFK